MLIGEMKEETKRLIRAEDYEILKAERLHNNVSAVKVRIYDSIVVLGFSWNTVIAFSINNYAFTTDHVYSTTTQKHKSQVLSGLEYDKRNMDFPEKLFKKMLSDVLNGRLFNCKDYIYFIENEYKTIEINKTGIEGTLFDYLDNHRIIRTDWKKTTLEEIKNCIRSCLFNRYYDENYNKQETTILINDTFKIKRTVEDNYIFEEREYKNLSFLNKLDLMNVNKIINI